MITFSKLALATGLCAAAMVGSGNAQAQTTDGYHTIQVFPVVVDTGSFAQRFTFRNTNATTVTISPTYFPAVGTSQGAALGCPSFTVGANLDRTFTSLRSLCPALAAGSQFGFLYTYEINTTNMPYAAFSRVANPQGNGFSVEAFPAHTFTSANTSVSGIRRLAAAGGAPSYQTNCFIGNLNDITPDAVPVATDVSVTVYNSAGTQIGSTFVTLTPGHQTRLLDVFAVAGVPAGDYNDATVTFSESGTGEPALMEFCTVQDNTSFGADFRIAKQYGGDGTTYPFQQDDHVMRDSRISQDLLIPGEALPRQYSIPASVVNNTHVIYFRHPDWVQCEIINPSTGLRAVAAYGLEMRLKDSAGVTIAGGNEIYGFGETYLGDKTDRNGGANGRYTVEVESTATNTSAIRPYTLHCQSGSGHTFGEMIRYNGTDQF